MKLIIFTAISLLFIISSCQQNAVEKNTAVPDAEKEKFVKLNQYFLKQEKATIKAYIVRHNWNMQQTESGLWYEILEKGKGINLKTGQKTMIKFRLELIDGTLCYTSDSIGTKEVVLGKGGIENGLDEGLQLLAKGGKARFILPTHLAYGVSGDGKCIPPRSAIVYTVELLN